MHMRWSEVQFKREEKIRLFACEYGLKHTIHLEKWDRLIDYGLRMYDVKDSVVCALPCSLTSI